MDQPEYITKLDMLPHHMRDGVRRWIEHGPQSYPGGFLSALLCNDLFGALGKADDVNRDALFRYATYFYSYAPAGCYGSPERFAAWKGLLAEQEAA
jgi:hypothetical protein